MFLRVLTSDQMCTSGQRDAGLARHERVDEVVQVVKFIRIRQCQQADPLKPASKKKSAD